jgi:hypothetical protein
VNNPKNAADYEQSFAEKCRKALEKSYGSQIPLPKVVKKKCPKKNNPNLEVKTCLKTKNLTH